MDKIQIRAACKVYQEDTPSPIVALESFDLSVKQNEFVAVVGPSGCGKSTLLYSLGGFLELTGGEILIDGKPVDGPGPDRGIVFQHFALFPWKTVMGNVEYGLAEKNIPREERRRIAKQFIDMVKLTGFEDVFPNRLSGGMQQRVALARMLACDPDILLMDEPFGALDAQTRLILQEELLEIWSRRKKTVIFVTHDVREAVFLAERVAVMTARPGRLKAEIGTRLEAGDGRAAIEEKAEEIWAILREEVEKTILPGAAEGEG
ncbi:MAG: ABC transporter ATP-binding protein [bacterium]